MLKVSTVLSSCIALSVVAVGVGFSNSPQLLAQNTLAKKIAFQAPVQSQRHLQVSLSRREVTVYQGGVRVNRYPIAIGRPGMETPTGTFQVAKMLEKPAWENPWTGKLIAANDKSNPLGPYFIGFFNKEGT